MTAFCFRRHDKRPEQFRRAEGHGSFQREPLKDSFLPLLLSATVIFSRLGCADTTDSRRDGWLSYAISHQPG